MPRYVAGCPVCEANQGIKRISPGPVVYAGQGWQVEHAYPCSLLGWLIIVLRRHIEALHDLTEEEAAELGSLQRAVARALHDRLGTEKEYSLCYGEAPGFAHVHVHVVPRSVDLDPELRGTRVFGCLNVEEAAVPPGVVAGFCEEFAEILRAHL